MNSLLLVAFTGMVAGFYFLFHISPVEVAEAIFRRLAAKLRSIKDDITETTNRKRNQFSEGRLMIPRISLE